jgi:RHS repeat-associated protein
MGRRIRTRDRLRAVLAAVVFAFATFAITASPVSLPVPSALKPHSALAAFCASNAAFTGRLTASSGSTTALARTKSATAYGYISSVQSAWSCTAYYRYSGIAWNTAATTGRFDWGNLINSTSVACNFVVGSTDYVKANSTTDCPDTDAEYALAATFDAQRVYQADSAHNSIGDFSFVHADCGTYYGAEPIQTGQDFAGATVGNRPGSNCDALTIDSTNTTQTITYDSTAPSTSFQAPATLTGTHTGSYTVQFTAVDSVSGFGGTAIWSLQRQIATNTAAGTCGTFANDTAAGNLVTGTTSSSSLTSAQSGLVVGKCYRWTLAATDQNGNVASVKTSATVITDTTIPAAAFIAPAPGTTTSQNTTSYSVSWTETESGSGIPATGRALQREKVAISAGACGTSWTADGAAVTTVSPVAVTLTSGFCYRWKQTLTDNAGNVGTQITSGSVLVDTTVPMANFTTPDEGTAIMQTSTSYTVAWTETAGSGTITGRSLQRQKGAVVTSSTCAGVTFTNDGSAVTTVSPVSVTGLVSGNCYRWVQTLTNSVPKTGATTSGSVLVDATSPTGAITSPETNRPIAGDVDITGSATDAGSFLNYQLEYGAGPTPSSWTTIGSISTTQVSSSVLGTWSTAGLSGVYTVRLTVRDNAGNPPSVTTHTVVLENGQRGDEDFFTRVPFDLGGGYTLDLGVANGEARLSRNLFSIPSYGPPQELGLTYSSLESGTTGKFGVGWMSNLTQYLTFDVASNIVTWHRADGGRVPFGLVAGTWTPLAGHHEVFGTGSGIYTITLKDQTKLTFESSGAGRLTKIENRFGKALTMVWGTSSATATDASGRATTLTIDSVNNRITGAVDSAGRTWGFGYTGTDLTTITDPATKVTTLGYDGSHHLTTVTRSRSRVSGGPETVTWTVGYTGALATSVADPDSSPTASTITYNAGSTDVALLRDVNGPARDTTTFAFDALGRVNTIVDPSGLTTIATFDGASNRLSEARSIDAANYFTMSWTYDTAGNVTTETTPIDGSTTEVTANSYNATNQLLTRSVADNDSTTKLVTLYTYDGSGHLTSVDVNCTTTGTTPPSVASTCSGAGTQDSSTNLVTNYAYTANDQLAYEQDPLGRVTKHIYDTYGPAGATFGLETSVVSDCTTSGTTPPSPFSSCTAAGTHDAQTNVTTSTAYDQLTTAGKAGLPTSQTDAVGNVTPFTYDARGARTTEVLAGDSTVPALTSTIAYDDFGNVLTSTDSWNPLAGGSVSQQTTHVYDLSNRETVVTTPAGVVTSTAYDAAGNAITTIADGVETDRIFDGLGRVVEEAVADAPATSHSYDGLGNEVITATPDGVETDRTFTNTGWVLTETVDPNGSPQTTSHAYDKLGRELTTTDANGIPTATTYDRPGRVLTVTVGGKTTTTGYDRVGNTVSSTDPAGIVTTTVFDPLDRPITAIVNDVASPTLPTEDVTSRTYYDAAGTTIAVSDPKGVSARTIPNVRGLAKTTIANCTDSGNTPTSNPPACVGAGTHDATTNVVSTTTFDGTGSAIQSITAVGTGAAATTTAVYDGGGRVQAVQDPLGTISRTFYTGDMVTKTVVNCTNTGTTVPTSGWETCAGTGTQDGTFNLTTTFAYDSAGNKTSETAPNGRVTTSTYDDANRLIEQVANVKTCTIPDPCIATDNITIDYYYDASGRQAAVRAPTADGASNAISRRIYDDAGRLVETIANCTNTGTTLDPALENPAECAGTGTADADTNVATTFAYDAAGNRTKLVEPGPSGTSGTDATLTTTRLAYDTANRLCRVVQNSTQNDATWGALAHPCVDAISGTTTTNVSARYTFDGTGNVASMIDGNGNTTSYGFDAAGRMTSTTDADGKTLVIAYNNLGQRIRQENRSDPPMTASVTWTYDGAGRILTRTANSVTTTYAYDANGNRTCSGTGSTCATAGDRITATYDRLNRPLTIDDDANGSSDTSYTYSLTSPTWTDPTGTYLVTLDKLDHATSVDGPAIGSITTTYRSDGQVATEADPNGNTTAFLYDDLGRELSRTTTAAGPVTRAQFLRTYNRAGQVICETLVTSACDGSTGTAYTYDPLARLTGSTQSSVTTAYGWDSVPNRTSVQVGAGSPIPTTYDAANRPLNQNGVANAYVSDGDGRLTTQPSSSGAGFQRYVWDSLGRLTKVLGPTGNNAIATYTYDPLDRLRMVDYGSNNRVRFRYVGLTTAVAQTIDDQSGTVLRNIGTGWNGERMLDWTGTNSNIRYYGTNAHHDTVWTASSSGTVSATLRYDPFGTLTSSTGTGLPDFRFQGSWFDTATSLQWVVTRWYAPALGRFLTEDSLLGDPIDPPSRHLYAYASGDPIDGWDPNGQQICRFDADDCYAIAHPAPRYRKHIPLVCTPAGLGCTVQDFDRMTGTERLRWLQAFQIHYATRGWFNAIEAILQFGETNHVFSNRSWFSLVDAHILAGVQDGKRLQLGKSALYPYNPGGQKWQRFFVNLAYGASDSHLKSLWGPAEQAATDYGVSRSTNRKPRFAEIAMKAITDIWRYEIGHPDDTQNLVKGGMAADDHYCNTLWHISFFCNHQVFTTGTKIVSSFFDPRSRWGAAVSAHYIYNGLQLFNRLYDWIRAL